MMRRKVVLAVLAAVFAAVVFWQYPALSYQYDYRVCLLELDDHYPNIASLNNAPDRPTYKAQAKLQCAARESVDRLEGAETADEQGQWGQQAIDAYSSLIAIHGFDSYRSSRAAVYSQLTQYELALADYNFLITNDPDNYWMYEQRAKLYLLMGQPTLALADYETLYEQAAEDDSNSEAYLERVAESISQLN